MMVQIAKIFSSLEGSWTFQRSIIGQGIAKGVATFKRSANDSNQLHYREEGHFSAMDGKVFKIFRDYLYRFADGKISTFFYENPPRFFHTLDFQNPSELEYPCTAKAHHLCVCDNYEATYEFLNPEEFKLSYIVTGPNKGQNIQTTFKKQASQ
jgi:hypothetical protein